MDKTYTTKKISDDTYEITITIPKDAFSKSYDTILTSQAAKAEIKGFRKGAVPKSMVEAKMKPAVLFETFERLAPMYVNRAISQESLNIVATPEYKDIPEMMLDTDLVFTIVVTVMPEFKLGDMKKVKVEVKKEGVKDEELDKIIKQLEENKGIKARKGTKKWAIEAGTLLQIPDIKDVEGLKEKIKEILQKEKESIAQRVAHNDALNKAIEICKIKVPQKAILFEAHEREHSFMHELEHMKLTLEQYAKNSNTTVQNIRELWLRDAKEALETDVFLKLFAEEKKIDISDEELEKEIEKVKQRNPAQAQNYDTQQWRDYIKVVTIKQKAYEMFISQAIKTNKK